MYPRTIAIPTKGSQLDYIYMIDPMYKFLQEIGIENYPGVLDRPRH